MAPILKMSLPKATGKTNASRGATNALEFHLVRLKNLLPAAGADTNFRSGGVELGPPLHALLARCTTELSAVIGVSEISPTTGTVVTPLPRALSYFIFSVVLVLENCVISRVLDLRYLYSDFNTALKGQVVLPPSEHGAAELAKVAELILLCCQFKELAYCHNM